MILAALLAFLGMGPGDAGLTAGMGAGAAVGDVPTDAPANTLLLDDRLQAAYPPGSPVAALVRALAAEGFEVDESEGTATLRRMDWLCELTFDVTWTAEDDVLVATEGRAGGVCM